MGVEVLVQFPKLARVNAIVWCFSIFFALLAGCTRETLPFRASRENDSLRTFALALMQSAEDQDESFLFPIRNGKFDSTFLHGVKFVNKDLGAEYISKNYTFLNGLSRKILVQNESIQVIAISSKPILAKGGESGSFVILNNGYAMRIFKDQSTLQAIKHKLESGISVALGEVQSQK